MKKFDFDKWLGVIDEDNHADDYMQMTKHMFIAMIVTTSWFRRVAVLTNALCVAVSMAAIFSPGK